MCIRDRNETTPLEDTQDSFLGLMECFGSKIVDPPDYHPLNYQHLQKAQEADKTIMKILKMENTQYVLQDFHGGGKTTSLVCFKSKIVIPAKLQRHIIMWHHTTLCHPGMNRTEETIGQHLWWPKMREHITNDVKSLSSLPEQ